MIQVGEFGLNESTARMRINSREKNLRQTFCFRNLGSIILSAISWK